MTDYENVRAKLDEVGKLVDTYEIVLQTWRKTTRSRNTSYWNALGEYTHMLRLEVKALMTEATHILWDDMWVREVELQDLQQQLDEADENHEEEDQ